uniref:Isoleucine--tRNA ligase, cytoplasmic n=1 Tax=Tanacetum cinerariifolium TaxID=118510 RepID=A0A6L2PCP7_TANCI|nr:isoleucine--tRNA ligase, cytoplasmic [Tanacetum cinerariifolium]
MIDEKIKNTIGVRLRGYEKRKRKKERMTRGLSEEDLGFMVVKISDEDDKGDNQGIDWFEEDWKRGNRTIDSYQVVNHVQKLRSKSALAPTDSVEVYISSLDDDKSVSARIMQSSEAYIKEALGRSLLNGSLIRSRSVVVAEETYKNILNHDFKITLLKNDISFLPMGKKMVEQFEINPMRKNLITLFEKDC